MRSDSGMALMITSTLILFVTMCTMMCCQNLLKKVPYNYMILFGYTLSMSVMISGICANTKVELVLMALFMTVVMVIAVTLYALTTKHDFTIYGGALFVFAAAMFLVSICLMFTNNNALHVIYSTLAVVMYGFYLIYDIQIIVGNHSNKLTYDDYVLAVLILYVDIIGIFIEILKILKRTDEWLS